MVADPDATPDVPEIVRLFPTFVWSRRLRPAIYEPINASVLAMLGELRRDLPPLDPGQAWQSGHALHRLADLAALVSQIQRAAASVLNFLKIGSGALEITGCWTNVSSPGAPHRMHTHPNNFLSGVYYLQVDDGADTVTGATQPVHAAPRATATIPIVMPNHNDPVGSRCFGSSGQIKKSARGSL